MNLPGQQGTEDGLPDWFHGIMSKRESEELLKNKEVGTFMIRLSPRTFGYILSYRGRERCRHFILNQLSNGELVVSGDSCAHGSLPALIRHYQNSWIQPFGEKLAQSYIKFSEINNYDTIEPKTAAKKNNKVVKNGQRRQSGATAEAIAPPLPERNRSILSADNDDGEEQMYSMSNKEVNECQYFDTKDEDVLYSVVKDSQVGHRNRVQNTSPEVLYSEVKLDHSLPSALGHLQSSTQSLSQETRKLSLDSRSPNLLSSLKDLSDCEVLEMRFATSIQTVNSKTITTPMLRGRGENPGSPFLHPNMLSTSSEEEGTYEQVPYRVFQSTNETANQISNYSMSCTSAYDHVSTRTSKEVTSREMNKKVAIGSSAQDNAYETVSREFPRPQGRKPNVAKTEKSKRFFFGEKKK